MAQMATVRVSEQRLDDYRRIERVIVYMQEHFREQPGIEDLARHAGLSRYHFERLFRRWAGISPKRFLEFLTAGYAKHLLERSRSVLDASLEAGLSGPGRLHDLLVTAEAVSPGEYKARGRGLVIRWACGPSPFGGCLVARTDRGICLVSFLPDDAAAAAELQARFPEAELIPDPRGTGALIAGIFGRARRPPAADGAAHPESLGSRTEPLRLHLLGTNFQIQVWTALLRIPEGATATYGQIASAVGRPHATRAVGSAIGRNPVAFLIPCHRVIRRGGDFGGYHWGTVRKRAILACEAARSGGED